MTSKDIKVPSYRVGTRYGIEEVTAMIQAVQSWTMTQGSYQKEFEEKFTQFIGTKHAFAVSSCTAAFEIVTQLIGVGPGDEVIVPTGTYYSAVIPIVRSGAKVVFADADARTYNMEAETIKEKITSKTKAIYVAHLNGLPADMDPILKIADEHNLVIVEDVAQAIGAEYKGKKVGSIGHYGCFSFHTHKNITTLGEGGMLTTNDDKAAKDIPILRWSGMEEQTEQTKDRFPYYYDVVKARGNLIGNNYCLGEVAAAVGIEQLKKVDDLNGERIERAHKLSKQLKDVDGITVPFEPDYAKHVYYTWPMVFDGSGFGANRDDLIDLLLNEFGIENKTLYPVHMFTLFKEMGYKEGDFPVNEKIFKQALFPTNSCRFKDEEVDYMIDSVKKAINILKKR